MIDRHKKPRDQRSRGACASARSNGAMEQEEPKSRRAEERLLLPMRFAENNNHLLLY